MDAWLRLAVPPTRDRHRCDEPASVTDAYALIKVLSRDYGVARFHILTNMVASMAQDRSCTSSRG
jgi:MinD-like ATPase involved in chromosome partitioning or flagellar assembly